MEYRYATDRMDAGYTLTLSNGVAFTRDVVRDPYRRSLVTAITNSVNGVPVEVLQYSYDALGRPTSRNADTFVYNERSELTSAEIAGVPSLYGYDDIGNSTNWPANCLNQYTGFSYDADGNILSNGVFSSAYDAANRLAAVSENGAPLSGNFYDARSRRVRKVAPDATHTFFYDDWNLVEERVAYTNGTTSTIRYY